MTTKAPPGSSFVNFIEILISTARVITRFPPYSFDF